MGIRVKRRPDGDDSAEGTAERPLHSIQEARNRIRQRKERKDLPEGGVTIYLREGTYRLTESFVLTEEDSGMPGREVRYQG